MIILGIDPGTTSIGYALLETGEGGAHLLHADLVALSSSSPREERLRALNKALGAILETWKPGVLALERIFFSRNQKTAIAVAEARGAILLITALAGLPVYEYTPLEVKKAVTGDGTADKSQLRRFIQRTMPGASELKAQDDVFDAIAIALTCYVRNVRISYRA